MEVTGRRLDIENKLVMFCEPCEIEGSKSQANGACRECEEYMCTTCFRHHLKSKPTRNHVLLSIGDFSSLSLDSGSEDVTKCKKHENETIKFYCRSHDVVGCGDCIVVEHKTCNTEYIKNLAKTTIDGDIYKAILKRVEDLERKKTDYGKETEKNEGESEKMTEIALKKIRHFRSEINEYLDKAEEHILSEVQTVSKENTFTLVEIENNLQSLSLELEKVKQMISTQLHSENALFINIVNSKSKISEIEKMFNSTTQNKMMKMIEFVRSEHIAELLNSGDPFGILQTKERTGFGVTATTTNTSRDDHSGATYKAGVGLFGSCQGSVSGVSTRTKTSGEGLFDVTNSVGTELFGSNPEAKKKQFVVGVRVRRGPDWQYGNQDGGGHGTLTGDYSDGWAMVKWDNGYCATYRVGQGQKYEIVEKFSQK